MEKALEILGIIICIIAALYLLAAVLMIAAAIIGGLADEREHKQNKEL